MIAPSILQEIISDYAPKSETLLRVGVVGSYARESFTENSDIDLVFDTGHKLIDEAIMSVGLKIKSILRDQFKLNTDIINYDTITKRINKSHPPVSANGYNLMLSDLKWIWSKEQ
jgi:predicted nucleotidyltransferase